MNVSSKSVISQVPKLVLYSRPLHPELFTFHARRTDRQGDYEVECWVVEGGHVVRFAVDGQNMVEVVLEGGENLPESGLSHVLPCIGEKEYDYEQEERIHYFTTLQTETLSENLYLATFREMLDFAQETGALFYEEQTPNGPAMVVLDCQKYRREFHVQSYHLAPRTSTVLRTQSVFEIIQ